MWLAFEPLATRGHRDRRGGCVIDGTAGPPVGTGWNPRFRGDWAARLFFAPGGAVSSAARLAILVERLDVADRDEPRQEVHVVVDAAADADTAGDERLGVQTGGEVEV